MPMYICTITEDITGDVPVPFSDAAGRDASGCWYYLSTKEKESVHGRRCIDCTNCEEVKMGWIAVDLDGTLALYTGWKGAEHIGEPVLKMLERVLGWLAEGKDIRIFTARASVPAHIPIVERWCEKYLGKVLPVTNVKDYGMIELWDDRCVQVVPNTGMRVGEANG